MTAQLPLALKNSPAATQAFDRCALRRRVLVTDGEQRAALALVRSLGRLGCEVYVCSSAADSLAGASRYCRAEIKVHDPLLQPMEFVKDVEAIANKCEIDALIPISEPALLALLPERARFGHTVLPFPDTECFKRICDKAHVLDVASTLGIAVPAQFKALNSREALGPAAEALGFPIVLKPSRSVVDANEGLQKVGVAYASDRDDLRAQIARLGSGVYPLLLQRRVNGPGIGIFLLRWDGQTRAFFAHRRLLEKPPSGGVSVYRESVSVPTDLLSRSEALLSALDWNGVAMIEYKVDAGSGIPYLMEINGRFWGSLQLAIDAGVDFPRLLLECSEGRGPLVAPSYRAGVRSRWFWGTVDHLVARRHSSDHPNPSVVRVIADLVAFWKRNDREEVFRVHDLRPFLRESMQWLMP
jgi:predicted ATP-grasp superfamily ATP-dependent carboligase